MDPRAHFHDRVTSLWRAVVTVGDEVVRSIPEATDAWLRREADAGPVFDTRTEAWSARSRDIELAAYHLIATQQPMGSDLRALVALVRLTEDVSRSGDLIAHVARSAAFPRHATDFPAALRALIVEMSATAARLFGDALAAFRASDPARAQEVVDGDEELDLLRRELFATLLSEDVAPASAVDLALLGRFYERLGDHAVAIANATRFAAVGVEEAPMNAG